MGERFRAFSLAIGCPRPKPEIENRKPLIGTNLGPAYCIGSENSRQTWNCKLAHLVHEVSPQRLLGQSLYGWLFE
jgi:hypothetical protein